MTKLVLAVLIAVAAVPMFAQLPVDFAVSLQANVGSEPAERLAVGQTISYVVRWSANRSFNPDDVTLEIDLPKAVHIDSGSFGVACTFGDPVRCTPNDLSGLDGFVRLDVRIDDVGTGSTTARIIRGNQTVDPNPANDVATHTFEAVRAPSLQLFPRFPVPHLAPGALTTLQVSVYNNSPIDATNVTLTVALPAGGTIHSVTPMVGNATCGITNNTLVCTSPLIAGGAILSIVASVTAPERQTGEDLVVQVGVTSAEADVNPADNQRTLNVTMIRQLVVSNANDEGGGSLRQAIHDVNALCAALKPCEILFRIPAPVPASGWFTIQPRTPLPIVTGRLTIDGRTQTQLTGDTNADGPEIEINGALVAEESGLRLRPHCEMEVRNLAVNGFSGYGIEVATPIGSEDCYGHAAFIGAILRENYLGTDPRGRIAKPNHRGLGLFSQEAFVYANVISGNRRAGIFAQDGFYYDIAGNKIGVGADGSALGNGAGIFINMRNEFPAGADIRGNVLAYNDGMAVARTRRGDISIIGNSIFNNLQQGIDIDLDGPSPRRANNDDVPNAPVLFSASYDAARNATIVLGRLDSDLYGEGHNIEVFASSGLSKWGTSQAEQSVQMASVGSSHVDLSLVIPGDLRGKWITATYNVTRLLGLSRAPGGVRTQSHRELQPGDTSELSNAVEVK